MRKLWALLALALFGTVPLTASADESPVRVDPVAEGRVIVPENHTLPACTNGAHVWMTYAADTYTDDGGHTYGPATSLTCNPDADNFVHIKFIPSSWTLAAAHTYCTDAGSDGAYTRWAATANVCPNVNI